MPRGFKQLQWISILFLLLIHTPMLAQLFAVDTPNRSRENRAFAKKPSWPASFIDAVTWPSRFQQYFDDNFALRNALTYVYSNALYHGLSVIPFRRVKMSADGWVFENLPNSGDCEKQEPSSDKLKALAESLLLIRAQVERAGARYLLVLIPSKRNVYRPDEPHRACPSEQTASGRLALRLRSRDPAFPVLDLFPALVAQKEVERVYFFDDPHWTDAGMFVGYQRIVEALSAYYPQMAPHERDDFDEVEKLHLPGAYSRFANVDLSSNTDVFFVPHYRPLARRIGPPAPDADELFRYEKKDVTYVREDLTEPRVLVFRNSFFEQMRPLLAEHCARVTYVWSRFNISRVRAEKPQVVIDQRVF